MIYAMIVYAVMITLVCVLVKVGTDKQRREDIGALVRLRGEQQKSELNLRLKELRMEDLRQALQTQYEKEKAQEKEMAKLRAQLEEQARDLGNYETLIRLKDDELNARDDERGMHWEELSRYILSAQASREKNSKLIVISNCCECHKKECAIRMPVGNIPEECPLKDAHALYSLQITAKGFSTAAVMNALDLRESVPEANEGVAVASDHTEPKQGEKQAAPAGGGSGCAGYEGGAA